MMYISFPKKSKDKWLIISWGNGSLIITKHNSFLKAAVSYCKQLKENTR